MKPYSHTKRQEPEKFSINKAFLGLLGFVTLGGLFVLWLLGPVWESVDAWCSASLDNQVKLIYLIMFLSVIAFGLWAYVRYKNQ